MQSVIAIIIIELMYLLGVLGKCWLCVWLKLLVALQRYAGQVLAFCSELDADQFVLSNCYDGYDVVSLIKYSIYCRVNQHGALSA